MEWALGPANNPSRNNQTMASFKEIVGSSKPTLIDFFAEWCGPCKIMLTNLEKVNESLIQKGTPKYSVYKFDIEQDMDLMKEWGVRGVPTIKIFENGEETFSRPGVMSPDQLLKLLDQRL